MDELRMGFVQSSLEFLEYSHANLEERLFCRRNLSPWSSALRRERESGFGIGGLREHKSVFDGALQDFFFHHFDQSIGDSDRADKWFAFAQAVAVRTARDQQVMQFGNLQVMLGHGCGMLGVKTFQAIHACFDN